MEEIKILKNGIVTLVEKCNDIEFLYLINSMLTFCILPDNSL